MARTRLLNVLVRTVPALVAGALAVGVVGGCGRRGPAEKALAKAADRYADLDAFSERTAITRTVSGPDGEQRTSSQTEFYFRRPNRVFYQMTGEETVVMACDGERLTVYSSDQGGYITQEAPADLAALVREQDAGAVGANELMLLAGSDPLEALADVVPVEDASGDGEEFAVVRGDVKEIEERGAEEPATAAQTLWIGREDSLIHRTVLEVQRGGATLRIEEVMEELTANPDLPDSRFQYEPPSGARDLMEE